MKCPGCQSDNPEDAKFCGKCRAKLQKVCPQCTRENSPENIFCNECGHDLRTPVKSAPADLSFDETILKTDPKEAAPRFELAISIFQEIKAENDLALAYSGMGRFHKQQGDTEQARNYLTDALEIFERLGTLIEPDKVKKELAELPKGG